MHVPFSSPQSISPFLFKRASCLVLPRCVPESSEIIDNIVNDTNLLWFRIKTTSQLHTSACLRETVWN